MTTFYPVQRSLVGPPQFNPTFDDNQYVVSLRWSLFDQRYYVQCLDLVGTLIFYEPLIESPGGISIESLSYDTLQGVVNGTTNGPHGFKIGSTTRLTVSGTAPTDYNGSFLVLATGPDAFSYPLTVDTVPDPASVSGVLSFDISIAGDYFSSTLVFRNGQFEVSP